MSEETAGADSAPEGPGPGIDPVGVALAPGGASQGQADAFLKKQEAFIDDPHLAQAKFKEANNHAPNWGRLHLKSGEALVYAGREDQAKAQLTSAARRDLSPAEKSELSSMNRETRL